MSREEERWSADKIITGAVAPPREQEYSAMPSPPRSSKTKRAASQYKYINFLENKLDTDIGFYYWKRYIAAAFWAQISMPVNLLITLMTALTTAQANAPGIISDSLYKEITIAALIITTLNTFFRPYEKMTVNIEIMKKWNAVGIEFESIYYSDMNNNYDETESNKDLTESITEYKALQTKISEIKKNEGPSTINFLTDIIHLVSLGTCLRGKALWLDQNNARKTPEESEKEVKSCCCRR
jgi:hypothetical protein